MIFEPLLLFLLILEISPRTPIDCDACDMVDDDSDDGIECADDMDCIGCKDWDGAIHRDPDCEWE